MSQTDILLGIEQLIDTIKCVDASDESSSHESDEDLDLMRILMQTWGLCGYSAEDVSYQMNLGQWSMFQRRLLLIRVAQFIRAVQVFVRCICVV